MRLQLAAPHHSTSLECGHRATRNAMTMTAMTIAHIPTKRSTFTAVLGLCLMLCGMAGSASGQALTLGVPREYFTLNTGAPCNGCKLYTYLANTTTPQVIYTNSALSVPVSNPIVMNSAGRPQVSASDTTETNLYQPAFNMRFTLKTSAGVQIWDSDNVRPSASGLILPSSFAVGDLLYADTTSSLARRADVAAGSFLRSGGVNMAPIWSTTTWPNSATTGDVLYASAANAYSNLAAGTSGMFLQANGAGMAPSWASAGAIDKGIIQGRLTLTSATPVTIADVPAATTLYWALYGGNQISLYTGSAWVTVSITQLSITMVGLTASKPYDVFIDYTGGTPALEVVVWTNDTSRATALAVQDGVYVQTGDADSRYVGTIYTDAAGGAVTDSFALRHVWNYYNRVVRALRVIEAADTWTYTLSAFQQANNNAANQVDVVVGVAEVAIEVTVYGYASNGAAGVQFNVGIGEDGITLKSGTLAPLNTSPVINYNVPVVATLRTFPAVGRHYYTWLERSEPTNTTTWRGDGAQPTLSQSGITGTIQG